MEQPATEQPSESEEDDDDDDDDEAIAGSLDCTDWDASSHSLQIAEVYRHVIKVLWSEKVS